MLQRICGKKCIFPVKSFIHGSRNGIHLVYRDHRRQLSRFLFSSFQPVKVLKGTFRAGRFAAIPRKVLVVIQFSVSVMLITGTVVVFRQIEFAKDRPTGYNRNRLIEVNMNTPELQGHAETLRTDLLNTGAVAAFAESACPISQQWGGTTNISWKGKSPEMAYPLLMSNSVTHDFGKAVSWQVAEGRDFSRAFSTDTSMIILNESAVKIMGFTHLLTELVTTGGKQYQVIGVVKDMIRESPFQPVKPTFFLLNYKNVSVIDMKLATQTATSEALGKIEKVSGNIIRAVPLPILLWIPNTAPNSPMWKGSASWRGSLPRWQYLFPAWDYSGWHLLLPNSSYARSASEKCWAPRC